MRRLAFAVSVVLAISCGTEPSGTLTLTVEDLPEFWPDASLDVRGTVTREPSSDTPVILTVAGGGETVQDTTYKDATWEDLPYKFEAGLQHYAGIIGLGAATQYLSKIGLRNIERHEASLNKAVDEGLRGIEGVSFIGPEDPVKRGGITSFNIEGLSPHDIASMLSASKDIMIRSGAHCVHSWFNKHRSQGSARASLYLYNTEEEVASFIKEMREVAKLVKR